MKRKATTSRWFCGLCTTSGIAKEMDSEEETKPKKKPQKDNPFSFFNYVSKDGPKPANPGEIPKESKKTGKKVAKNNTTPIPQSFGGSATDSDSGDDLFDDEDELFPSLTISKPPQPKPPTVVPPATLPTPAPPRPAPKVISTVNIFEEEDEDDVDSDSDLKKKVEELKLRAEKAEQETTKIKQENKELKANVKKMKLKAEQAEVQVETLHAKLEAQKKKEAADTKELEDMIVQVEENLVKTTQRAQMAEAQIEQLKMELSNSRISNLRGEDNTVQNAEHLKLRLLEARDKAKVASSSLLQAASDAEISIRDLLKGIDTLRTASGILSAIDKLTIIDSNL